MNSVVKVSTFFSFFYQLTAVQNPADILDVKNEMNSHDLLIVSCHLWLRKLKRIKLLNPVPMSMVNANHVIKRKRRNH